MRRSVVVFFLCFFAGAARAQTLPDMNDQRAWTESDKQTFLKYLQSSQKMPAGQVKEIEDGEAEPLRPARYVTLDLLADTLYPVGRGGHIETDPAAWGFRALAGTHLFTWVRAFTGLQYDPMSQRKLGGGTAELQHFEVPAELEFALIPLGQDQTRNVLIRAGAALHEITGAPSYDFSAPVTGFRPTWNLGLGFEYQVPDTPWRVHALAEGYRSMYGEYGTDFYGLDISAGAAYTF